MLGMVKRTGYSMGAIDEMLDKLVRIGKLKAKKSANVAEKSTRTQRGNEELFDSVKTKMVLSLLFILLPVSR